MAEAPRRSGRAPQPSKQKEREAAIGKDLERAREYKERHYAKKNSGQMAQAQDDAQDDAQAKFNLMFPKVTVLQSKVEGGTPPNKPGSALRPATVREGPDDLQLELPPETLDTLIEFCRDELQRQKQEAVKLERWSRGVGAEPGDEQHGAFEVLLESFKQHIWEKFGLHETEWMATFMLILSDGNDAPMHQDVHTGEDAFSRELDQAGEVPCAWRVLINLVGEDRYMVFRVGASGEELLTTSSDMVAMNAAAAGHARLSNTFHGRFGNGLTLGLDLALPMRGTRKGSWPEARYSTSYLRGVSGINSVLKTAGKRILTKYEHIDAGMQCDHVGQDGDRCPNTVPEPERASGKRHQHEHGFMRKQGVLYCPEHYAAADKKRSHHKK